MSESTHDLPVVTVGVLGCGTVGSQVVRLLTELAGDFGARAGARIELAGVAVRDLGKDLPAWVDRDLVTDDAAELVTRVDIAIELIGGIEPARSYVRSAMEHGASVVTANKALLAQHGPELFGLATAKKVDLYYEAAVAGAVPVVYALRESLAGDTVTRVLGIVNGTTNYILDEMTRKGLDQDVVLAEAQRLGYAEADPSGDVDGIDAANKAALLAALAFHTRVRLDDVDVRGIRDITAEDIRQAGEDGYVFKLLAIAEKRPRGQGGEGAGISVRVHPALVPDSHPLASVHGAFNAVVTESEAAGQLMFYGAGAGGVPTASAVLSDVVAAALHRAHGGAAPKESFYADLPILGADAVRQAVQLRLDVHDVPGALAEVAGVCATHGVSIQAVRQGRPAAETEGGRAVVVLLTHEADRPQVDAVVADLRAARTVHEVLAVTPIVGSLA